MGSVFVLQHSYAHCDGHDETKMIGVYSSEEKARNVIEKLKYAAGFCEYPTDCFYIDEYEIDQNHWEDGFFKADC